MDKNIRQIEGLISIEELEPYDKLTGMLAVVNRDFKRFSNNNGDGMMTIFELSDGYRDIKAIYWDIHYKEDMDIIDITKGYTNLYKRKGDKDGDLQITLYEFEPKMVDRDFLKRHEDFNHAEEVVYNLIEKITDVEYRYIVNKLIDENYIQFTNAPGGEKIHHAYRSGLLEHISEVALGTYYIAQAYPSVNLSLALAGALLHDIGKVKTLEMDGFETVASAEDHMFDHLFLGIRMVEEVVRDNLPNMDDKKRDMLIHLIGSHHKEREWGSLFLPNTFEAFIVHTADTLSVMHNQIFTKEYEANDGLLEMWMGSRRNMLTPDEIDKRMKS